MITRQIGWSNESNLLYQILKQIKRLSSIIFSLKQEATPKYKLYTAILNQTNSQAPDTLILENTIGELNLTFNDSGKYGINSNHLFTDSKTIVNIDAYGQNGNFSTSISYKITNENLIEIFTNKGGEFGDDILVNTRIEIRVYN